MPDVYVPCRDRIVLEKESKLLGADLERVQVWEAFSQLYLDSSRDEQDLVWLTEILAESPFCFQELAHILFIEVTPVCFPNVFVYPGGEWMQFDPTWLIQKCQKQQKKHPFKLKGNPDSPNFLIHILGFTPAINAYLLLYRVRRFRRLND